jgi:hypothetical protein
VSPVRILPRHLHHQPGKDIVYRWPSGRTWVGPFLRMRRRCQRRNRVWGDQAMSPPCSGQPPDQGGEDGSVRPVHAWSRVGAAEDGDLMPQDEELDVRGGGRAAHQQDRVRAPGGRSNTATAATRRRSWLACGGCRSPLVSGMRRILEPHGLVNGAQYRVEVTPVHTGSVSAGSEGDPAETGPSPAHGHARRADRPGDGGGAARSAPGSLVAPSPSLWSGNREVIGFSQVRPVAAGGSDDLDDGSRRRPHQLAGDSVLALGHQPRFDRPGDPCLISTAVPDPWE